MHEGRHAAVTTPGVGRRWFIVPSAGLHCRECSRFLANA